MNIEQSLGRILERREPLADLFYTSFLDEYPEVRQFFVRVNMKRQAVLLTIALQLSVQHYVYVKSFPAIPAYLKILGERHQNWGIPREHYPKFREAMLSTLSRFHGHDWNAELAQQWKDAIDLASDKMLEGYTLTS
jgi:hemoglobin-like flavoprotein